MKLFSLEIQSFLSSLLNELSKGAVPYAVMRDYATLPESIGNDIDLLIAPRARMAALTILYSTAASHGLRLALRYSANCTSFFFFLDGTTQGVHLDIFDSADFRGLPLVSCEEILNRRRVYKNFFILDQADEIYLNFVYRFLIRGEIREKYRSAFSKYAQNEPIFQANLMETFGEKSGEQIRKWLAEENFTTLTRNHFKLFCFFLMTQVFHRPLQTASGLLFTFRRLLKRVCCPEGAQGLLHFDSLEVKKQEVQKLREALEQVLYKSKISILKNPSLLNRIRSDYRRFMGHLVIFLTDAPLRHRRRFNFYCRIQTPAEGMTWEAGNRADQGADTASLAIFILQSIAACQESSH